MKHAKRYILYHYEHVGYGQPLKNCVDWSLGHVFASQHNDVEDVGNRSKDTDLVKRYQLNKEINYYKKSCCHVNWIIETYH